MAKKRISSVDLSWIISEQLSEIGWPHGRASLAVVSDEKDGWRVIVANRGRCYLTAANEQRLAEIQLRLRSVYQLRS
jgi:hypothetical protein